MAHILIVDDDDPFRTALRATLTHLGHSVTEAANGALAWDTFQEHGAEIVIMDLIMPEQEGLETIRLFRKKRCSVKIIATSGGGRTDARDLLKTATLFGADAILPKPFTQAQLIALLGEIQSDPNPTDARSTAPN
jgi:CheY-like chemotaxis protein